MVNIDIKICKEYLNVPYKTVDNVSQVLDIYFPDVVKEDMPVLIYVHGGGFLWYTKDLVDENFRINHVSYKNRLNELGYVFISVEYRKEKNMDYPCLEGQISDVKDAIKWVKKNSELLSCSQENIGLWGLSAGGALALSAALNPDNEYKTAYDKYSSNVKYVIDFYAITDIYDFYRIEKYNQLNQEELEKEFSRVDVHTNMSSTNPKNYSMIKEYVDKHSPISNYKKTNVKIAIHHGDDDKVVSYEGNALPFYLLGLSHDNEIYLTTYEGKDHGFWWDTKEFYDSLENKVISEIKQFSNKFD